jgi:hypothetical protein
MDNFQKYSRLMLLLVGGFFGFILFIALLIFVLRLLSITMIHIPGFDLLYQYVIIIIPYAIFFAAYYYLYNKIRFSKSKISRSIAKLLLAMGCIICITSLILSTVLFLHVKSSWLKTYEEYSHYSLIVQIAILFISAGVLASGDAKEKDWMERGTNAS